MKKVLIVEDEEVIAEVMLNTLIQSGFEAMLANRAGDAWDRVHSFVPDLILLDILIPDSDGWELLEKFRNHKGCFCTTMKVVVLSNIGLTDDGLQRSRDLGAIDFWLKANYTPKQIAEKIREILGE